MPGFLSNSRLCGIATLTKLDMTTNKLLANADRWSDDGVYSRDIIDLAMLDLSKPQLRQAIEKAFTAYGESVEQDLKKAINAP